AEVEASDFESWFYLTFQAATTTVLTSSSNPSVFGQSVTFTANITSPAGVIPSGTVTFLIDGTSQTVSFAGGTATLSTSSLKVGTHTVTATYNGDKNFAGSTSAPLLQTVNRANTTTRVTSSKNPSSQGEKITFTAIVITNAPGSGTPSGTVQFLDGATLLGSQSLTNGLATFSTSGLSVADHI